MYRSHTKNIHEGFKMNHRPNNSSVHEEGFSLINAESIELFRCQMFDKTLQVPDSAWLYPSLNENGLSEHRFLRVSQEIEENHFSKNLRFNLSKSKRYNRLELNQNSSNCTNSGSPNEKDSRTRHLYHKKDSETQSLMGFISRKSDLITTLRQKLMHDRFFSIHEIYKQLIMKKLLIE